MSNITFGIGVYDERDEEHVKLHALIKEYLRRSDLHGLKTISCTREEILAGTEEIYILFIVLYENHLQGISLKNQLQHENFNIPIIFVGNKKVDLISAFGKNVYAFLLFPLERNKLFLTLDETIYELKNYIMVNISGSKVRKMVPSNCIIYIVADDVYTRVYTKENESLVRRSLREWESLLGEYGFFRIGKSVLVQLDYVKVFEQNGHVVMKDGREFVVGRRRKRKLNDRLRQKTTISNI